MIGIGARHAERVSFALGAEPPRVAWAVEQVRRVLPDGARLPSLGLYLNVCVHDDVREAVIKEASRKNIFFVASTFKPRWLAGSSPKVMIFSL